MKKQKEGNQTNEEMVSQQLLPSFPHYGKSLKNHTRFGHNNPQIALTMQNAIQRHEQNLRLEAMEKAQHIQHFEDGITFEIEQQEREKQAVKDQKAEVKKALDA